MSAVGTSFSKHNSSIFEILGYLRFSAEFLAMRASSNLQAIGNEGFEQLASHFSWREA